MSLNRLPRAAFAGLLAAVLLLAAACGSSGSADTAPVAATSGPFVDPEGDYQMLVEPGWDANHGVAGDGIEVWLLGQSPEGAGANVNVSTQPAPGVELADYLAFSVAVAPDQFVEFALVGQGVVDGSEGQPLGFFEYDADGLRYLSYFAVGDDVAVVATLTAAPLRYDAFRAEAETVFRTLQRTS